MSDEELERLANAVIKLDGGMYGHPAATKLGRGVLSLLERLKAVEKKAARMQSALEQVERWDGFPRVPDLEDLTRTVSYRWEYGSNGERDFMRHVASIALSERP
jgi:hypothetical protein